MSRINDTAKITLSVNGQQVNLVLKDIEKSLDKAKKALDKLTESDAAPQAIERQRKVVERLERNLAEVKAQAAGVRQGLESLDSATPRQLKKELKSLTRELNNMRRGADGWDEHVAKIKAVKSQLQTVNEELKEHQGLWTRFKNWSSESWPAILLGYGAIDGAVNAVRGYVDEYAEMDQEMANVRKFTGMTEDSIDSLNEEFKKMDTRTPRDGLNKLAQEAGRLGKTSERDVLGFVRAADQINVALDDLGDGATLTLSKLTGIFGDEAVYGTEQSLLKVGSVVNELSQNCSASAPYLTEFASRVGGVGAQANMTIPQIMGFAAVLDSNAQKVEASSTALSQVIVRMMQEPAKYAKVAGLDVQKFTDMLKTDANGALIEFLSALQMAGGMDVLSPMFKDMGETGSRAITALSTLATHIDEVKAQQEAANVAFEEGTSVTKEFNVQNNTVQASLEKAKNAARELRVQLGEYLAPVVKNVLKLSALAVRSLLMIIKFVANHKVAIVAVTAAIVAYSAAVRAKLIYEKLSLSFLKARIALLPILTGLKKTLAVATSALSVVYNKLRGNAIAAARAQITLKKALAGIKWGAIGLAAAAAAAVVAIFAHRTKELTEAEKANLEVEKEAQKMAGAELSRLKALYEATVDVNQSMDNRLACVAKLQEAYPDYFGNLTSEEILAGKAADAYERLRDSILESARAKGRAAKIESLEGEIADIEADMKARMKNAGENEYWDKDGNLKFDTSDHAKIKEMARSSLDRLIFAKGFELIEEKRAAQEELARANVEHELKTGEDPTGTTTPTDSPTLPYVPQFELKQQEKDARKAALLAKQELAKAKAEFKQAMQDAKGDWEELSARNTVDYGSGLKGYEDYISEKERLDLEYYNKRIELYEGLYDGESEKEKGLLLAFDEDYKETLLKRAELQNKHAEAQAARSVKVIQKAYKIELAALNDEFYKPSSPFFGNQKAQEEALFQLKMQYLIEYRDASKNCAAQYNKYQEQIEEESSKHRAARQKEFNEFLVKSAEKDWKLAADKQLAYQLALLKEMLEQGKISIAEFAKLADGIKSKFDRAVSAQKGQSSSPLAHVKVTTGVDDKGYPVEEDADLRSKNHKIADDLNAKWQKCKSTVDSLRESFKAGKISAEEFSEGMATAQEDLHQSVVEYTKSILGDELGAVADLGMTIVDIFKRVGESGHLSFEDIAQCAQAAFGVMQAGLGIYSQFAEAQSRIEIARTEKKYDRMISAAQGHSYKTSKLEKEKGEKINALKAEATNRDFKIQVIEAVAQTAVNALNAYGSVVRIPVVGPTLAPIAAAAATAMGMVQVALLKKQQQAAQAEGYAEGGFTRPGSKYEPAGVVHAGEWVASQKLLADPVARPLIDVLDYAQRNNTLGSLRADDVSRSITAPSSLVGLAQADSSSAMIVAAVAQNAKVVDALTRRLNEPFVTVNTVAGDKGIKQAQDEYRRLTNNVTPKSRRR